MPRLYQSSVEKKLAEVSQGDRIIRIAGLIVQTEPLIIDDGSGRAIIKGTYDLHEGRRVRVIGHIYGGSSSDLPEIEPIVVQDISRLDIDLYRNLQEIKTRLAIPGKNGKQLIWEFKKKYSHSEDE